MANELRWQSHEGKQLLDAVNNTAYLESGAHRLDGWIPREAGIYMWKLNAFTVAMRKAVTLKMLIPAINKRLETPVGTEPETRLKRVVVGESLIKGKAITKNKTETLENINQQSHKKYLDGFIQSLDQHAPILYVGKASGNDGGLQQRISQHLTTPAEEANTHSFGKIVRDPDSPLTFNDMTLHYCVLGDRFDALFGETKDEVITILEWIASMTTIAGYNQRDG